jgi:hypothetical protein
MNKVLSVFVSCTLGSETFLSSVIETLDAIVAANPSARYVRCVLLCPVTVLFALSNTIA